MSRARRVVFPLIAAATLLSLHSHGLAAWEITDRSELFSSSTHLQDIVASRDGMGGMLLAAVDQVASPDRVLVSRVDHTGSEIWGDNGIWLPINLADEWNSWPLAVTHDDSGGGYFAFRAGRVTYDMLRLAYVTSDGSSEWIVSIDNLGVVGPGVSPRVTLVPTANGEVIVVFERLVPSLVLYCARVDATGTILWHGPVNASWSTDTHFVVESDGQDGALVGFFRDGVPDEIRMQRIQGSNGARLWGSDGTLVWSGAMGAFEDIAPAGMGGAYIVRSASGVAYAQRLDQSGNLVWATELLVHDTHTAYFAYSSQPRICPDGAGGFILFHGVENMYAQRVDANGARLWGTSGVTVATQVVIGLPRAIDADGTGGALLTYTTSWLISGSTYCRQIDAARIGALGAILWDEILDMCDYSSPGGVPTVQAWPEVAHPFADGSNGGGIFAWNIHDAGIPGDPSVWGMGIDAAGNPPTPRLTYLVPDAAEPDQTGPYLIHGDYLELGLGWALQKEDGSASLPLAPDVLHNYQMLGGSTTLAGLTRGAYHLIVDRQGTPQDTLQFAVGIGAPLPCGGESAWVEEPRDIRMEGSQRQAVYTSGERLYTAWIEYEPSTSLYSLALRYFDGVWHRTVSHYTSREPLSHATMDRDPLDRLHVMFVEEVGPSSDHLVYLRIDPSGEVSLTDRLDPGTEVQAPVVAVTDEGYAHVVFEKGVHPSQQLWHWVHTGEQFLSGWRVTTAPGPRSPDLVAMQHELELVYVDDGGAFGLRRIERAHFDGGWNSPEMLGFGVDIRSPSVAADGAGRILYAWVLDNELVNGIAPLVHIQLRTSELLEPAWPRPGMPVQHRVSVTSPAPGQFLMLTTESEGGPHISVFVRDGDGHVFFPRVLANAGQDVDIARLAARDDSQPVVAYWRGYDDPHSPVLGIHCERIVTSVPEVVVVPDPTLRARPNPFNPGAEFCFELARPSRVELTVYDLRGRVIRHLHRGELPAGPHAIAWDGRDDDGAMVATGTYLARLDRGDGGSSVTKGVLLK